MGFPDRIERSLDLAQPPAAVWAALTTAEGLGTWFGTSATVDMRPGGTATLSWDGGVTSVDLRVERLDEPTAFGFTWAPDGTRSDEEDLRRTYVEFTLEPVAAGTRLTVVESGFAQLADAEYRAAYDSHSEGWTRELGDLVDYLSAA